MKKLTLSRLKIAGLVMLGLFNAYLISPMVFEIFKTQIVPDLSTVMLIVEGSSTRDFPSWVVLGGGAIVSLVLSFMVFYIIAILKARRERCQRFQ